MIPADALEALGPLLDALAALGIPYHVGGSVASSIWGPPRTTRDADVVIALTSAQVPALLPLLTPHYYVDPATFTQAVRQRGTVNLIHFDLSYKVDVFVLGQAPFHQAALARAVPVPHPDAARTVAVTSPEDIVVQKLAWYRAGQETSERQWLDVRGVLQMQEATLDQAYMAAAATELGVGDLLAEAWATRWD